MKAIDLLCAVCILLLLISLEGSSQTTLIWERENVFWSAWMFKKGFFSVADIIIMLLSFVTCVRLIKNPRIHYGPYLSLCLLLIIYVLIGFVYNIAVYSYWKTFLYDFKVTLLLVMPYVLLSTMKDRRILELFKPKLIVIYFITSQLIDYVIVMTKGGPMHINLFHLPMLPFAFGFIFTIPAITYATRIRYRVLFVMMFLMDVMQYLNVGGLYGLYRSFEYMTLIFFLRFRMQMRSKILLLLILTFFFHALAYMALTNPFTSTIKPIETRVIEIRNVWDNFNRNIPGIIGKGLGSTWFEIEKLPEEDIYAVGTSLGQDIEEGMALPVKFVFHYSTCSLLYKWGIIGSVLLIMLCGIYIYKLQTSIDKLVLVGLGKNKAKYLKATAFMSFFFIYHNFQMIGSCYYSLITSLLAFYIQNQLTTLRSNALSSTNA